MSSRIGVYVERHLRYSSLQRQIRYFFRRVSLLDLALTHPSKNSKNNQRLEFLGDAILGMVVSDYMYSDYPEVSEGTLTRLKIMSVNNLHLKSVAMKLNLRKHIQLGPGTPIKTKKGKLHADAVEALIGAIYEDGGIRPAQRFIKRFVIETLPTLEETQQHPKTALANWTSKQGFPYPIYKTTNEPKPPHHLNWTVSCTLRELSITRRVTDASRKEAEKRAAEQILVALGVYGDSSKNGA